MSRIQFVSDDIHPVRSNGSSANGRRDALKASTLSERHDPRVFDVEEGSDYKGNGAQDRDIRKRQVGHHQDKELRNVTRLNLV